MKRQAVNDSPSKYTNGTSSFDANGKSTNGKAKYSENGKTSNGKTRSSDVVENKAAGLDVIKYECGTLQRCINHTLVPLFLMAFCPNLIILLWYTAAKCDGSFMRLYEVLTAGGTGQGIMKIWTDIHIASPLCAVIIIGVIIWSLVLMWVVPGPRVEGPVTPNGNTPIYKDNGFSCYVITMLAFFGLAFGLRRYTIYSVTIVYDHFDEFLGTLTVYSHILCFFLHLKGLVWPSSSDCGTSGNLIFDYYWGTELYPRIAGIDIKVFTNCRFGMTVWALLVCTFALKNYELYGFVDSTWVSATLQMVYFTKFFWWESGYMRTIDIMLDRAGFYICWGCLVYIPGVYASVSMYLVNHNVQLGPVLASTILILGVTFCIINYLADKQKLDVRRSNGTCLVWGRIPELIRAEYQLEDGETRTSLLLVSGYWGIARHFHYVPELASAFLWSLPAMFDNIMPYTYFFWLIILLVHRTYRDDTKCSRKYQKHWKQYCTRVPYKIIPYLF